MKGSPQELNHGRLQSLRRLLERKRGQTLERIRELLNDQQGAAAPSPSDELDDVHSLRWRPTTG